MQIFVCFIFAGCVHIVFCVPVPQKRNDSRRFKQYLQCHCEQSLNIANEYSALFMYSSWIKKQILFLLFCSFPPYFVLFCFVLFWTDIDECKTCLDRCHEYTTCNDRYGSCVCVCKPGYTEDGEICKGTANSLRNIKTLVDHCNYSEFSCGKKKINSMNVCFKHNLDDQ